MQAGKSIKFLFLLCGLVLTMSASSVCAQDISINKIPLMDFAGAVKDKTEKKEVDLSAPFLIELSGELNENGKLDAGKSKFVKAEGNPQIVNLTKAGVEALSDSGILAYLRRLEFKTIQLTISQDEKTFSLTGKSLAEVENRAKSVATALNMIVDLAKQKIADQKRPDDANVLILLRGAKVTSNGKEVIISVAIPAGEFQQLVTGELSKLDKTSGND